MIIRLIHCFISSEAASVHQVWIKQNLDVYATCGALPAGSLSGFYMIDPDGTDEGLDPFTVYCDMTTDGKIQPNTMRTLKCNNLGGGWTVIASFVGADDEVPLVGDEYNLNVPTSRASSLNRAQKAALGSVSTESILVRPANGVYLKVDKPLFDSRLLASPATTATLTSVTVTDSSGTSASAVLAYTLTLYSGGGDFAITSGAPDQHSSVSAK